MRIRTLAALILSLCLALGGIPALAADQEAAEPPALELEIPDPSIPPPPMDPAPDTKMPSPELEPPAPEPEDSTNTEPPPTDQEDERKTVSTAGELCAWLRSLGPEGGEVFLGDTVTLTWEDSPYFDTNLESPAVIHTGPYSLVYDGEDIGIVGQVGLFQLEGEGVDAPVLEIRGDQFFGSDWNEILARQEVTASGRDGQGGVAVRITSDSETRNNLEYYETRGRIHAYGAGAVGLQLAVPALVNCLDIDVTGEDALAIDGPEGTTAFLCILTAESGGHPAGDGVNTDSSLLPPETEGPRIDCRVGIDPQIPLGARRRDVETIVGLYDFQRYRLTDGNYVNVDLIYDDNFTKRLDTSVPGPLDIPVALPKALQGLGLEGETGFAYRVWIRDPALPILTDIWQNRDTVTFSTSGHFLDAGAVWDPATRLWRSDDGGATWTDVTDWDAVTWCAADDSLERFQLDTAALDGPISLVLENSAGWGNVVTLTPGEEGIVTPGTGGDRDGGDREEQPGNGGGTHPGGGSSNDSPTGDRPSDPGDNNVSGGIADDEKDSNAPMGDAFDNSPNTNLSPQTGFGIGRTPSLLERQSETRGLPPPENLLPEAEEGLILPWPDLASADSPTPSDGKKTLSTYTPPPKHIPAAQNPAQNDQEIAVEISAPSSTESSAAPELDAETTPSDKSQTTRPQRSQGTGLVLPVLVLFVAGGLTALVTLWKKRGGH